MQFTVRECLAPYMCTLYRMFLVNSFDAFIPTVLFLSLICRNESVGIVRLGSVGKCGKDVENMGRCLYVGVCVCVCVCVFCCKFLVADILLT